MRTKKYDRFRGVDFSTDPALIDDSRSPLCQNLISDSGGYPEKRLGWRTLKTYADKVNGIFRLVDKDGDAHFLVHHGKNLGRLDDELAETVLSTTMNDDRSTCFYYDNKLYILDGAGYYVYDGTNLSPVTGFVPTTTIGSPPEGGGTSFEAVNFITPYRKNSFKGDGTAKDFHLDAQGVTDVTAVVDGSVTTAFTVNTATGVVTFTNAPADGQGVDNVVITFAKTIDGYADRIKKCRFAAWFGAGDHSRVFVSGNPEYKNWDFHSGLYDPTYFPDNGYTRIGSDASAVMGYLKQHDTMLIVKEDNDQDATVYSRTAELSEINGVVTAAFPVHQGVVGVGAVSMWAFGTLRDDPLFLSKQGVFTPTLYYGGVKMQRSLQNKSFYVDAKLTKEPGLDDAVSVVWDGYYVLCVNGACYIADSRQRTGKSSTEATGYEWYYWTNVPARVFAEFDGELYFGTEDSLCKFRSDEVTGLKYNDDDNPVDAVWATKQDDDGDFMLLKSIPRLGSGVMIKPYSRSSVEIAVQTETSVQRVLRTKTVDIFDFNNMDFKRFTFSTNDAPDVMPFDANVRRYRTLRIIARNRELGEGFGVYGIIKRYKPIKYVKG